jgi:hypothetical protein
MSSSFIVPDAIHEFGEKVQLGRINATKAAARRLPIQLALNRLGIVGSPLKNDLKNDSETFCEVLLS